MTVKTVAVAPEYLSFYIAGIDEITVPLDHDKVGIVASDQCINVGCLYWNEGDTTITLGPSASWPRKLHHPNSTGSSTRRNIAWCFPTRTCPRSCRWRCPACELGCASGPTTLLNLTTWS